MVIVNEVKTKIIEFLRARGPSLPIQIAKELKMNSLFVSAFLSELAGEKKLKVSSLKVGGSPLYFLEGQEQDLEKFYNYLHPKEAEAYLLLKENKVLRDSDLEPAIRVALRAIRDFAFAFKDNEEIYWRYLTVKEPEVIERFSVRKIEVKEPVKELVKEPVKEEIKREIKETEEREKEKEEKPVKKKRQRKELVEIKHTEDKKLEEFENPLVAKTIEKPKKEKPKSEFVLKVIKFLEKNNFKIIEEKEYKVKEYNCVVQISSELGPINFLTQAKDKKSISDEDLRKLLSESQKIPIPSLVFYTGELSKKAKEYCEKYSSILKVKRIE